MQIPDWLEHASEDNVRRAEKAAQIGYMPYYGPQVADFNQTQRAVGQSKLNAAAKYGLIDAVTNDAGKPVAAMTAYGDAPQATDYGNGLRAHGSGDLFEQALAELESRRPGQVEAYNSMFIDPQQSMGDRNTNRIQSLNSMGYMTDGDLMQAAANGQIPGISKEEQDWWNRHLMNLMKDDFDVLNKSYWINNPEEALDSVRNSDFSRNNADKVSKLIRYAMNPR